MGFFSKFEGKMEDAFEGAADRMTNSPISPVQIAKKAEKQMRREKMVGAGKQYAPTLYTVLVNPDDDQRLFGYYPTLAGETETYLAAKAADEGLVMDGQPLVRFIVDDGLKHGKFDVIAEPVAAPIIAQLRAEEMQRYGIAPAASADAPYAGGAPAYGARAPMPTPAYGHDKPRSRSGYDAGPYAAPAYDEPAYAAPAYAEPSVPEYAGTDNQTYYDIDAGFVPHAAFGEESYADDRKPPLPYVPEDELDYSIDYGEYTFDSQDFEDYRDKGRSQGRPLADQGIRASGAAARAAGGMAGGAAAPAAFSGAAAPAAFSDAAARAAGGMAGAAAAAAFSGAAAAGNPPGMPAPQPPAYGQPAAADTVVFAAGAGQANAVPSQSAVRACLIDTANNRTYTLASGRLLMGRESKSDIVVNDINASRTHAELRYEPLGVWTVTDLGSTNGTLVNGAEIATSPLREGDVITIGMTNYQFTQAR